MIGAIEQAIMDRIQQASDAGDLGYRMAAVESYAGQLDGELSTVLKGRTPAAWVVFNGEVRDDKSARGTLWRTRFSVAVLARAGRNAADRRHGAADHVGAYQLAEDVKGLLEGQALGLEIEPIRVTSVKALFNGKRGPVAGAVYAVDLVTAYAAAPPVDAGTLADFHTFHADWDLPPHGNVAAPLPADDPDAADTVTLQEDTP